MEHNTAKRQKRTKGEHLRVAAELVEPAMADDVKNKKVSILTKIDEARYNQLKELQHRLGYKSMYSLLEGLVYLQLRCIRDYPSFHGGKAPEKFEDLEDMLEMYMIHRIPFELS